MTERGLPIVDGAPACPFVAFDDDRDERATSPDHRHRCYAENPPAPRALAHQEAYCLSSAFPVCPIFQDWARREAARATTGQGGSAGDPDDALPPLVAEPPPRRSGPHTWAAPPPWLRGGRPPSDAAGADAAAAPPPERARTDDTPQGGPGGPAAAGLAGAAGGLAGSYADRLVSHDVAPPSPSVSGQPAPSVWDERDAWADEGGGAPQAGRTAPAGAGVAPTAADPYEGERAAAMEDVPPRRRGHERVDAGRDAPPDDPRNDAYAPAWERPRRLEAYPTLRSRRLSSAILPSLLLAVIVVLIAGAALFFVPSFLGLGSGPGAGASPSSSLPGASLPAASVVPTVAPAATPTTYVVQAGDTMSRIAKKFGVSLSDLIAANADTLPNPDKLQIGDTLIIPTPAPSELPGASQP